MEVIVALAIFLIVMAATAQGLVSSFAAIKMQEERTTAINATRSVLSTLRQVAASQPESEMCPEGTILFPCAMMNWLQNFPETLEDAEGDTLLMEIYGGFFALPDQRFIIELTDEDGNAAIMHGSVVSSNTNPVWVAVETTWRGFKGQVLRFELKTIMTNR